MSEGICWMCDTTGGIKKIPLHMVAEKEAQDWFIIGQDQITSEGIPKQTYYPAYDRNNKFYKSVTPEVSIVKNDKEILTVEVL